MNRILLGEAGITQEKDLAQDQLLKYARDFAELYDRERQQRIALQASNRQLETEIQERIKLEEALVRSEQKYRSLFEDSRDAIYVSSRDGVLLEANPSYCELTGYNREELVGASVLKNYADPSRRPIFQKTIEASGVVTDFAIQVLTKNGEIHDCLLNAIVRRGPDGDILGYQGIIRDVSEQKKNQEMKELARRMDALAHMAGGVAHEIRNPLAISSSAAQLLVNDKLNPLSRKECLDKILVGINRASLIVDNLVTFARNLHEYPITKVNVVAVVQEALRNVSTQAGSQNVEVKTRFCQDCIFLTGSEELLQRAFFNMFFNGLATMPDGGVLLVTVDKNGRELTICIQDSGYGMSDEQIARIFDPFFSGFETSRGLGLGLSVASRIVHQHRGTIEVYSVLGRGSTFTVRLPEQGLSL